MTCTAIPAMSFLPTQQDWDDVRVRMEVIVQRVLVQIVPWLKSLRHRVSDHIEHEYSNDMAVRSNVVNIGAIDANPASTAGEN